MYYIRGVINKQQKQRKVTTMTRIQKRLMEVTEELRHAKKANQTEYSDHCNGKNSPYFAQLEKLIEDWRHEAKTESEAEEENQ
jgi:hypothetical protein